MEEYDCIMLLHFICHECTNVLLRVSLRLRVFVAKNLIQKKHFEQIEPMKPFEPLYDYTFFTAAIPGNSFPSKDSSIAPPPVDT